MASPPFSIAETTPGDSDIASQFPAAERTFRDIVESWLSIETDPTTGRLRAWPAGARTTFNMTTPPTGWTKDVTHNNKALRLVNGTVGTGGSTAFTSVFTSRTVAQANLPVVNLSHSLTAATHTHGVSGTTGTESADHTHSGTTSSNGSHSHTYNANQSESPFANGGGQTVASDNTTSSSTSSDGSHTHTITTGGRSAAHTHSFSVTSGASGALAVSGTVALGGSGTAMDFAVQYVDVVIAERDA